MPLGFFVSIFRHCILFSLYFLNAFSLAFAKTINLFVQGFWVFFLGQDTRLFLRCLREGIFVLAFLVVADASPSRRFKWTACRQGCMVLDRKNATYW